jgi:hypothetical protein
MILSIRPIEMWPGALRTHNQRRRSPFEATYTDTMDLLDRELRMLRATVTVAQIAVNEGQIRRDGRLRAAAYPDHPGVILSFQTSRGSFRYAGDRFTHWHANLRAIALGLEALRKIERYGIGSGTEQYTGFLRIETAGDTRFYSAATASEFIARHCGEDASNVRTWWGRHGSRYYRTAAAKLHPDQPTGDTVMFQRLQAAKAFLDAAGD